MKWILSNSQRKKQGREPSTRIDYENFEWKSPSYKKCQKHQNSNSCTLFEMIVFKMIGLYYTIRNDSIVFSCSSERYIVPCHLLNQLDN